MPTTTNSGFTLTQATVVGRQAVKFIIIGLVALIVGRSFLSAAISFYKAMNPPPPPPPSVGFGALPPLVFPETNQNTQVSSYQLQIANGRLPSFGDRAKVFLMTKQSLGLLSDQRARQIATEYNFVFAPEILSAKTYRWSKSQPLESTLEMDLSSFYFSLNSDFLSRPELITVGKLPTEQEAVARVKAFLDTASLLPADVATAAADITYLKALGGEVQTAVSFSDADFLQVDLHRTPIDNQFRMFTPGGYKGTIHAIVARGLSNNDSVVKLDVKHQEVDYTQVHTYPLRSTQSAWQVVQAGQAYVADAGEGGTATIRSVSLAYFDSFEQQSYLQPIYVFEGDNGFLAYVSAINPEFVQSAESNR